MGLFSGFPLAHRTWPAFCACLLASYQSSLSRLPGVTIGSQQQSRGKWAKACRYCRYPKASWGNSHMRFPQWLMGKLPNGVHYAAIRNYIPLIPSQNHICLFPNLLLPPSHEALSLGLWMLEERNESLEASRIAGEASHSFTMSPFSHGRHLKPNGSHLGLSCATWEMGDVGEVKLFSLSTPIHPNSYFFLSSRVLQLLHWKPRSPQRLSCPSMGNCPGQCSPGALDHCREGWNCFTGYCRVHSWYWGLSVYYLMHRQARLFPGPLAYGTGSHNSHRGSFICGWINAKFLLLWGRQKRGMSYATVMVMSLPSWEMFWQFHIKGKGKGGNFKEKILKQSVDSFGRSKYSPP